VYVINSDIEVWLFLYRRVDLSIWRDSGINSPRTADSKETRHDLGDRPGSSTARSRRIPAGHAKPYSKPVFRGSDLSRPDVLNFEAIFSQLAAIDAGSSRNSTTTKPN